MKNALAENKVHHLAPRLRPRQVVFRLSGCEDRVILVDEVRHKSVLLHRPNFQSRIDRIYGYLIRNPNRVISSQELGSRVDRKLVEMDLTQFVSHIKFKGQLRRLFFRASKNHIVLHDTATLERMQQMHIAVEDILPYFK